ncbi:trypsin-like peptidase domain-containing protein [Mucilaginibacter agri]|uniref:Trypsin-like serine protease n=1 Tax=Mucilaginibacter agri TaxID=2695265 RepID=A0A966DT54_9SPHI|nr:trypsin-like peptidase domain-containing protein [Mucilaginibacter agri]NCD68962.1 trypsin-like serine protease [Mucilaginibacter agri]
MNDRQLHDEIERYLSGEMSREERAAFDALRKDNADIERQVNEHRQFIGMLKQFNERRELEQRLNAIHNEIDVHSLKEELTVHPSWIVQLWRNHHSKISVAASIAIFAMLATLFFTGYFKGHDSNYTQLRMQMESYKRSTEKLNNSTNALIHDIKASKRIIEPAKFGGTGFALTANGYIVTNYHVVKDADSVYVQNETGDSYHARIVYTEPGYDVALLRIDDSTFKAQNPLPYTLKRAQSDLGEDVYTIGYPRNDVVYGKGYLSSATGFHDDTTAYQVSIPVNPGNSGGPLLDNKGNIIGIISGKQSLMEGAAFAVKSEYLLKAIKNMPSDSVNKKIVLNSKNTLASLSRAQQIKKVQNYVYQIKVYSK